MESVYRAYKDSFELFADIAEIIRQEASDPATMGCVYIQIDAPELAVLIDPAAHPPRNATLRTEDPRPHHLKLYFARID
jgi:methionine synthase II (cobalamin-independent)